MQFQILSHAGLSVTARGKNIICDPWIVGSTYWRSWWNYPPVSRELVDSLKPDFIYLTHIHWDHFQGPSLRRLGKSTPILVPRGDLARMKRDLNDMGFHDVRELDHGVPHELAPGFKITSWHFGVFLDSALVIEADGTTILNANDAKFMGRPLEQLLARHPKIDFVLRSHSSANGRLCYEFIDRPGQHIDDLERYSRNFADFARATGARWAIPFASNHCHLHEETWRFNEFVQTPIAVRDYFERHAIRSPELKVMVSGDAWSTDGGFALTPGDWFERRDEHLERYRVEKAPILAKQAAMEAKARVSEEKLRAYFERFCAAIPRAARLAFRGHPIAYVLRAGDTRQYFEVDIHRGTVRPLDAVSDAEHPIQVHTSAHIMRQCIALDLFSHLPISKRVTYRVRTDTAKYMSWLNLLFNFYEYELLPLDTLARRGLARTWTERWREVLLYAEISVDVARGRGIDPSRYLDEKHVARIS